MLRFLRPEISLEYLRNNVDLVERSFYSDSDKLGQPDDSKDRITSREQTFCNDKRFESNNRKHINSLFVSTADSSFLKFLQESQNPKDFDNSLLNFKEQEQFEELISDEMIENALSYLPSDSEVISLVELFLKVCETNYCYIHPHNFEIVFDTFLQEKAKKHMKFLKQNWIFMIILFGVLAISSGYDYIGEGRSLPSVTNSMLGLDDPGKVYYKASLPFVGFLLKSNSIYSVQALLLLGLFVVTDENTNVNSTIHHGYLYVYLSVEKAIINKLHINDPNIDPVNREFMSRLWWSCYCLERRYGINLGKPEIIKRVEITAHLPQPCTSLNKRDGTSNYLNQRALIELTFIFSEISGLIYERCKNNERCDDYVSLDLRIVKNLLSELEKWSMKYSAIMCNINLLDPNSNLYRAHVHLSLHYLLAKLYVGKPFLLYKVENYHSNSHLDSTESHFIDYLTSVCVDSAFKIIQLLCILNKYSKLGIYSATDLNFCNLSMFVIVLWLKIDKSSSTVLFLKDGLKILKTLSMGCASAKITFSRLSKLELLLSRACEIDKDAEIQEIPDDMKVKELDISQFPDSEIEFKNSSFYNEGMESKKLPYNMKIHHDQTTYDNPSFSYNAKSNEGITNIDAVGLSPQEHSDTNNYFEDWTKDIDYLSFNFPLDNSNNLD